MRFPGRSEWTDAGILDKMGKWGGGREFRIASHCGVAKCKKHWSFFGENGKFEMESKLLYNQTKEQTLEYEVANSFNKGKAQIHTHTDPSSSIPDSMQSKLWLRKIS